MNLGELQKKFHHQLVDEVLPFWMDRAIDPEGGICTCLTDDGHWVSRDKWLWSQWRAVWVFSRSHRSFGGDGQYLRIAERIADFCIAHGWDADQRRWRLAIDFEGQQLRGCESVYTDAFAVYGLTELASASGNENYAAWAAQTAESSIRYLRNPSADLPQWPYPLDAGEKSQGIPMIFSLVLWEHFKQLGHTASGECALELGEEIFRDFYRPSRGIVLERVSQEGRELAAPRGTVVVPGHVIENMWFQIHIARDRNDSDRIGQCSDLLLRHLELGWDQECGGLFLAVDIEGGEADWGFPQSKLWWPHTEALYATLLAHRLTGDEQFLQWFNRIFDYSYAHYPVAGTGEWRQRLDRRGNPFVETVALPVKDPFHLPRALILSIELCRQNHAFTEVEPTRSKN